VRIPLYANSITIYSTDITFDLRLHRAGYEMEASLRAIRRNIRSTQRSQENGCPERAESMP
jgi:hypothetical protein